MCFTYGFAHRKKTEHMTSAIDPCPRYHLHISSPHIISTYHLHILSYSPHHCVFCFFCSVSRCLCLLLPSSIASSSSSNSSHTTSSHTPHLTQLISHTPHNSHHSSQITHLIRLISHKLLQTTYLTTQLTQLQLIKPYFTQL